MAVHVEVVVEFRLAVDGVLAAQATARSVGDSVEHTCYACMHQCHGAPAGNGDGKTAR